jgi:SAM-dependent methyltransferase
MNDQTGHTEAESGAIRVTDADFRQAFGGQISDYLSGRIKAYAMAYRKMSAAERDQWLLYITAALLETSPARAGEHRQDDWDRGWRENLEAFERDPCRESLTPRYYDKYPVLRFNGDFIVPASPNCERNMLATIQDWLFDKWLRQAPAIYEFGCGTGHNLFRARNVNPSARLYGCDWAASSNHLVTVAAEAGLLKELNARRFNLFAPDPEHRLEPGAAVYTVAALEQLGERFAPFLDYLLANKPSVCVHIEPIAELLDPGRLLDYLSIAYFKKRGYLSGFLTELTRREANGELRILDARRTHTGSLFIEGYSAVVWRPR